MFVSFGHLVPGPLDSFAFAPSIVPDEEQEASSCEQCQRDPSHYEDPEVSGDRDAISAGIEVKEIHAVYCLKTSVSERLENDGASRVNTYANEASRQVDS